MTQIKMEKCRTESVELGQQARRKQVRRTQHGAPRRYTRTSLSATVACARAGRSPRCVSVLRGKPVFQAPLHTL
jgi:hypothetical protein